MSGFLSSGLAFALILAGMLCEALCLVLFNRKTGRGIAPARLAGDIGAGACLLLAAIAALRHAPWPLITGALLLALVAHLFDLAQRWNR